MTWHATSTWDFSSRYVRCVLSRAIEHWLCVALRPFGLWGSNPERMSKVNAYYERIDTWNGVKNSGSGVDPFESAHMLCNRSTRLVNGVVFTPFRGRSRSWCAFTLFMCLGKLVVISPPPQPILFGSDPGLWQVITLFTVVQVYVYLHADSSRIYRLSSLL